MYKATQDKGDYIKRVASHATKPSRRGIIKDIPPVAQPEQIIEQINQFQKLNRQLWKKLNDGKFIGFLKKKKLETGKRAFLRFSEKGTPEQKKIIALIAANEQCITELMRRLTCK